MTSSFTSGQILVPLVKVWAVYSTVGLPLFQQSSFWETRLGLEAIKINPVFKLWYSRAFQVQPQ